MIYKMDIRLRPGSLLALLICICLPTLQAQEIENPYLMRYGDDFHWTQQLSWHESLIATQVDDLCSLDQNKEWVVDSAVLHRTMKGLSKKGGGVLYFPKGIYLLAYDITLPTGVILMGDKPKGVKDGKSEFYRLQTFLRFPTYKPGMSRSERDTLVFEDISNQTAFKSIYAEAGAERIGLVNVDLNRAVIDWTAGSSIHPENTDFHSQVVIFGIRQNNAVLPHPEVPSDFQEEEGNGWQRWPHPTVGNINLSVEGASLIANCRLNDEATDSYRQLGYKVNDGMSFDGSYAVFDYCDHVGIKLEEPANGVDRAGGESNEIPQQEPANSLVLRENYLRVTQGNDLVYGNAKVTAEENDMDHIEPQHESRIADGLEAKETYYDILMKDPARTLAGRKAYRTGDTLPYRLMKPLDYDPAKSYPLVICLHGSGERGTDNWSQLRHFSWFWAREETQKEYPSFLLMPQYSEKYMSLVGGFDTDAKNWMTLAMFELMEDLEKEYGIDPSRIYLTGISSGAFAVWELICHYPEKFAAAVPVAGYKRFNEFSRRKRKEEKRNAKTVPIWAFHGALDEWIPPNYARITVSELKKAGADPKYTQFEGVGHLCWDDISTVDGFLPWLFGQTNQPPEEKKGFFSRMFD